MKKISFPLSAALLLLMLTANGQGSFDQRSPQDEIDEFIIEQMEIFHVPGLSASIVIGNSVVWNNNYGFMNLEDSIPVNDSTLFNVFSIGKALTASCVMQLWDKQLIGLDQNINNFLPFQIENPWNNADSITARMLMSHSSTINNGSTSTYGSVGDPTISLSYFLENYLCPGGEYYSSNNYYNGAPGSVYHYDNYGVALNGFLVEPLTSLSFNQYAYDSLFAPLGMDKSAWFLEELNIDNLATGYHFSGGTFQPQLHLGHPAYPGLSLRTTALELANYTIMLLNEGIYNGENILSGAAVDSMSTIQNPSWSSTYGTTGLGLYQREALGDRIVWGHNGGSVGGYAAQFHYCREENSGIVITTNSEQYVDPIAEYLFDYALTITQISEEQDHKDQTLTVYPNPANGIVNINFRSKIEGEVSLSIYNIGGKVIKQDPIGLEKADNYKLNVAEFSPGIYFISLQTESGIITKKLIIE